MKQVWNLRIFHVEQQNSIFVAVIFNLFQGPALVLVESVGKGNLEESVYYFQIVDFREDDI